MLFVISLFCSAIKKGVLINTEDYLFDAFLSRVLVAK